MLVIQSVFIVMESAELIPNTPLTSLILCMILGLPSRYFLTLATLKFCINFEFASGKIMTNACLYQKSDVYEHLNSNIIHLGEKMESLRSRDAGSAFQQWQQRWSADKSLLDQQFEKIEEKLLSLKSSKSVPQKLSIYDVPADAPNMRTMGPM